MFGTQNLALYAASCIALNITPGQDTMYIIGRSMAQGKRAGIISAMGIMSGCLIHTTLAAAGLSAILSASALAFSVVKLAGAFYLVWIGIGLMFNARDESLRAKENPQGRGAWALYRQGMLTNLLNPKVALFFLSFLPQFVDPNTFSTWAPFLVLGLILFTTGSLWCIVLVAFSSWLAGIMRSRTNIQAYMGKALGGLFIGLGLKLAFVGRD
jgi:threonine/homoserine/homoserine lactone efflux protein